MRRLQKYLFDEQPAWRTVAKKQAITQQHINRGDTVTRRKRRCDAAIARRSSKQSVG